jgi:hypothetical protein
MQSLWKILLVICGLSSGMALIFSLAFSVPLSIILIVFLVLVVTVISLRILSTDHSTRIMIKRQLEIGFIAGLAATTGYDLSRAIVTIVFDLNFAPFKTWPIFGQLIIGEHNNRFFVLLAGFAYHLLNGIAFSIAFCLFMGGRNWKYGLVWAFGLEVVMLLVYPIWLDLSKIIGEFTIVSIIGHTCYGLILGIISDRKLSNVQNPNIKIK